MIRQIKCPNCGLYNTNADYCSNCNTLLSSKIRRKLQLEKQEKERKEKRRIEDENDITFVEKYSEHRFLIVRIIAKIAQSVSIAFAAIGVFIAWLVTAIAA